MPPVDETAYSLDTYPGHSLDTCDISIDFPTHFWLIFDYLDILWFISTSRCTSNITCWSHSHCDLLPITSQHASPLFHPSYLRPIISLEIEVFSLISHGHSYYCDTLLKRWLLHSSHDIPIHFAIFIIWFRIFSPFYIYLTLPYPHKKNRREICSPHHLGLLWLHCDCVLHFVLQLLAINLRPISHFLLNFYHFTSSHCT